MDQVQYFKTAKVTITSNDVIPVLHVWILWLSFYGLAIDPSMTSTGFASGETLPPGLTEEEAEEMQLELTKVPHTVP